ncbi:MAG: YihY/virulence factor BrkB family protein [Sporichthyaceae bacterium]
MVVLRRRLARFDAVQGERTWLAIPVATLAKFYRDRTTHLAAMMAFWAFFSLFPLLLTLVTLLSFLVPEEEKQKTMEIVAGYLPLLDLNTIGGLNGSVFALVVGLLSALWSGSAVVRVTQFAFNSVWDVPLEQGPGFLEQLRRSVLAMSTIGLGLLASAALIGFLSGENVYFDPGPLGRALGFALTIGVDVGLFVAAFRILTDSRISLRDVLPGAICAGLAFWVLKATSSVIITRYLHDAAPTYGTFATVITILWWFYLQSNVTLLGAQLNVVLKHRLYPCSLLERTET